MRKPKEIRLAVSILMAISLAFFLPGLSIAGDLEPSGPPAPTMKTLDQIPPTWSQKLQCDSTACPRFEIVMDGAAVLDKETGLVWRKSPTLSKTNWSMAKDWCYKLNTGGRMGWRLPTIEELASLVDKTETGPALPSGHPFTNVESGAGSWYWSATTNADYPASSAYYLYMYDGTVGGHYKLNNDCYYWCVRGGQGYDPY